MLTQQTKSTLLLFVIFLLSIWAVNYFPEKGGEVQPSIAERTTKYFAYGYSKIQMDQAGLAKSKLTADYAVNFSGDVGTELRNPVMTVYKDDKPPWIIRSKTGQISADGKNMAMNGPVFIDRAGSEATREVNIKTSNLRVQPDRNYAETDDWAELVSGLDRISGVGMELFYQDPLYIKLLANIKGRHEYN